MSGELDDFKADIKDTLKELKETINDIKKYLWQGNGQPSVSSQLINHTNDIDKLKTEMDDRFMTICHDNTKNMMRIEEIIRKNNPVGAAQVPMEKITSGVKLKREAAFIEWVLIIFSKIPISIWVSMASLLFGSSFTFWVLNHFHMLNIILKSK